MTKKKTSLAKVLLAELILTRFGGTRNSIPLLRMNQGCREIKRCEKSKRTLLNPFVSRLTEFNVTLKLLRITDQDILFPLSFAFGEIGTFGINFIAVGRRTKRWEAL